VASPTLRLVRDELMGFAKSKVMIVLWVLLPLLAVGGYLLIPTDALLGGGGGAPKLTATRFMSFLMSSIAGTVAALMVAVDIISEKNRNVYVLFVIRPIRPEAIILAKFLAVFACVTVACVVSLALGMTIDAIRGTAITAPMLYDAAKDVLSLVFVIALSATVGCLFGVLAKTILVAVILILYVGQNVAVIPMLPGYLGWLPDKFWIVMTISALLVVLLMWASSALFRRTEY
jgi:ABC-type transport system involved in multi-copper enzyme maturation permease subunit